MKINTLTFIFTLFTLTIFSQNLITNGTFDGDSMQLNCEGWVFSYGNEPVSIPADSCVSSFFQNSAEKNWSLYIAGGWPGTLSPATYITGLEGNNIYQLSYDMKTPVNATAYVAKLVEGELTAIKQLTDTAANWRNLSLVDTIAAEVSDTIVIGFTVPECDLCPNSASFDNIIFTKDVPMSVNENIDLGQTKISTYPNPASDVLVFEIEASIGLNNNLTIYNASGAVVKTASINNSNYKLAVDFLSKGLYYYKVEDSRNKKLKSKGKFIVE